MQRIINALLCTLTLGCAILQQVFAAAPATPQNVRPAWVLDYYSVFGAFAAWEPVPEADFYHVYRFHEGEPEWSLIATNVSVPFYFDSTYSFLPSLYSVTALNADGESAGSDAVTVTEQEPSSITVSEVRFDYGEPITATIEWACALVTGDAGIVEWGPSYAGETNYQFFHLDTNFHVFQRRTLTNLAPLTTYHYRITSISPSGAGLRYPGTFITPDTNHAPVVHAHVDSFPTASGTYSDINYWATDPELDDYFRQEITYRVTHLPTNGVLSGPYWEWSFDIGPFERYSYESATHARGLDHFTIVANDGFADSAPYVVTVTNWWNSLPPGGPSELAALEDTPVLIPLPTVDADGDPLTYINLSSYGGTVTGMPPNLIFTPATNSVEWAYVDYTVTDGYEINYGSVQINITPVNDKPVLMFDTLPSITTWEDQPGALWLQIYDLDGYLGYELVEISAPQHGTLSGDSSGVIYTPATNFYGKDTFSVAVREVEGGTSDPITVSVTVSAMNDDPIAFPQTVTVQEDTERVITGMGSDVDGSALTFLVGTEPTNGSVVVMDGTKFVYQPNPDFNGIDGFAVRAFDEDGGWSLEQAWITVEVIAVNDGPIAAGSVNETREDQPLAVPLTASDVDGDGLTFVVISGPTGGTLTGTTPNLIYTPKPNFSGTDSFTFLAQDGMTSSAPATVTISVAAVNDSPTADAQAIATAEDTEVALRLTASDIEADALSFHLASGPYHGVITGTAPNLIYTPEPNFHGTDTFIFVARDGEMSSAPATVMITINAVNDAPVASAPPAETIEDAPVAMILGGSDLDGDGLTYLVVSGPTHGALSGTPPNLTFTPEPDFNGSDSFTFVTHDGIATSAPATVIITVSALNDAPAANARTVAVGYNTSQPFTLTAPMRKEMH